MTKLIHCFIDEYLAQRTGETKFENVIFFLDPNDKEDHKEIKASRSLI